MKTNETLLSVLTETLPPIIARKEVEKYLAGVISTGYLANLNSQGIGPKYFTTGRRVFYLRKDLIEWLEAWLQKK